MEREHWLWIRWALKRLPRRSPRGAVYDNREVLAVLLWAALHRRPIVWATRRRNWPMQAWRRRLPDQSTMSRRLRDPELDGDLQRLLTILQHRVGAPTDTLIADGKPLPVSEFTGDPDAATGYGAGRLGKGYKLHALIDSAMRLIAWTVRPMNEAECVVAAELIRDAAASGALPRNATILADESYDSNPLHAQAAASGTRLIAPRRRPDRKLCKNRKHHPGRVEAVRFTETDERWADLRKRVRTTIERWFGILAGACGLYALPPWARRLGRVRLWVGAAIILDAARQAHAASVDA
jgi:hypothetical protein